jgi:hypothetical protein
MSYSTTGKKVVVVYTCVSLPLSHAHAADYSSCIVSAAFAFQLSLTVATEALDMLEEEAVHRRLLDAAQYREIINTILSRIPSSCSGDAKYSLFFFFFFAFLLFCVEFAVVS